MAFLLAFVPYLLIRGPVNRIARGLRVSLRPVRCHEQESRLPWELVKSRSDPEVISVESSEVRRGMSLAENVAALVSLFGVLVLLTAIFELADKRLRKYPVLQVDHERNV